MNVTTIFGETINESDAIRLHSSYNLSEIAYFSIRNFDDIPTSRDAKEVISAYYWNEEYMEFRKHYFLRKDCKRLHRFHNRYIAKLSLDKVETIISSGKTYHFLNERERFNAGYVFHIQLQEWIDLKVEHKNLWGNLILIQKFNENNKFVVSLSDATFQNIKKDLTIHSEGSARMESVPSFRLPIYYHKSRIDKVIFCSKRGGYTTKFGSVTYKVLVNGVMDSIVVSEIAFRTSQLGLDYQFTLEESRELIDLNFNPTEWNGEVYLNTESAEFCGYVRIVCPSCNRSVSASHSIEACERELHRNPRYSYHESGINTKQIDIESKVVFRIGVEIEKQSFLGSKHSNNSILQNFGWKKERDGSLCDRIGYELVSPTYPLFTDDLINEVREIESSYPNLINGNDMKFISSGKDRSSCGGHIHFSRSYTRAEDLFEMISGYMPLIYAIYRKRSEAYYCIAKEKHNMKQSTEKMQAVRIIKDSGISDRIEFRIFPLVDNIETLQWRIKLLRVMANNPSNRAHEVINMLADKDSDLYKLFSEIFTADKIKKRAKDAIELAKRFDTDYRNYDFSLVANRINQL
jgi:hypothetical protein